MPDNPYILGTNPFFDRPSLAVANLAAGDLKGAGKSLWDPSSLTPEQRKKLSARLGLEGPLGSLLDITANPLVLMGLALTMTHKMPNAAELMPFSGAETQVLSRARALEWMMPLSEVYRGTKIPPLMEAVTRRYLKITMQWQQPLLEAVKRYEKSAGSVLTPDAQVRLSAYLDDLSNPANRVWTKLIGRAQQSIDELAAGKPGAVDLGLTAETVAAAKAALKDPLPGLALTEPLQQLGDEIRTIHSQMFDDLFSDKNARQQVLQMLSSMKGLAGRVKPDREWTIEKLEKYFPHVPILTPEERTGLVFKYMQESGIDGQKAMRNEAVANWSASQRIGLDNEMKAHQRALATQSVRQATKNAVKRRDLALPDPEDLAKLGVDPALIDVVLAVQRHDASPFYSLKFDKVWEQYSKAAAHTFAWTVPEAKVLSSGAPAVGYGARIKDELEKMESLGVVGQAKARLFRDSYQPIALGGMTASQAGHAMQWAQTRQSLIDSMNSGQMADFLDSAAPGMRTKLSQFIAADPMASYPGAGRAISNFFYSTTLAANPLSAARNLMQPLVTLPAFLPIKPILEGYKKTASGLFDYYKLRTGTMSLAEASSKRYVAKGATELAPLEASEALLRVFPDFHSMHQELEPLYRTEFSDLVEDSFQRLLRAPTSVRKAIDKGQRSLMFMFSQSELSNRLVAFYAARTHGLTDLVGKPFYNAATDAVEILEKGSPRLTSAANEFASHIVGTTQFGSGYMQKPSGLVSTWAPWSQFASFPTRTLGTALGPMMRDKATLGRGLIASGAVYGLGKELLNTDVSGSLLFGAMPEPTERGPFAPLPIVPPLLQLAGSAGLSVAKGDTTPLRESLPILVPGGVGMARAVGMVPGGAGVSQALGRPYADYKHRTPDGRIPVYTKEGSLVGYFTTGQIYARALGFQSPSQQTEQAITTYLMGRRDLGRKIKRDAMQALAEGDAGHVLELSEQYQEAFPRSGGLPVGAGEMRALHLRRDVTRMERLLETMPQELRGDYTQMISAALGPNYPAILGLAGPGLSGGPIMTREPYRAVDIGQTQAAVSEGLHGVGLREKLRREGHEATRGAHERRNLGFGSFGTL